MSGELVSLLKATGGTSSGIPAESSARLPDRPHFSPKKLRSDAIVIVEAVNNTGVTLSAYQCVALDDGALANDMPNVIFPTINDDPELTQYGSVLEDCFNGGICHVQISGSAYLQVYQSNANKILIGEIVYALDNQTNKAGLVINKASGDPDTISKIPLGRCIMDQATDTVLLRVHLSGPGGGSTADLDIVQNATTVRVFGTTVTQPSGNPGGTIDGTSWAVLDKKKVLLMGETQSINGVWTVNLTGNWTKVGQLKFVLCIAGTLNSRTSFMLISPNTYDGVRAFYG